MEIKMSNRDRQQTQYHKRYEEKKEPTVKEIESNNESETSEENLYRRVEVKVLPGALNIRELPGIKETRKMIANRGDVFSGIREGNWYKLFKDSNTNEVLGYALGEFLQEV